MSVCELPDRGDPTLMDCPSDQTVYILSTTYTAAVYWTPPTANDTSAVVLSSNKDPGDNFESGGTIVTYTATDQFNNEVSCSFTVVVQETLRKLTPGPLLFQFSFFLPV